MEDGLAGGGAKKVDPKCVNVSNPYHVCGEHCIGKMAEAGRHEGRRSALAILSRGASPSSGGGNSIRMRENRNEDFRHANGSSSPHGYANHNEDPHGVTNRSATGTPGGNNAKLGEDKVDTSSSNPSHEHPSTSNPSHELANHHKDASQETLRSVSGTPGGDGTKLGEDKKVDPSSSNSSHEHPNASNPSHELVNHHKDPPHEKILSVPGTPGGPVGLKIGENRKVNLKCINASNPYHVCAGYCSKSSSEVYQPPQDNSGSAGRKNKAAVATAERSVLPDRVTVSNGSAGRKNKAAVGTVERNVLPGCVNAFNPYHKCGDYCKKKMNNS